jgi:hypothetical protein
MYGVITTVPAPVEMYDGMHRELVRRTEGRIDGLLVHIGRATDDGFEVLEIWESQEHCDRFNEDVVFPLMREPAGDQPAPAVEQAVTTFDVRGLVIPRGDVLV